MPHRGACPSVGHTAQTPREFPDVRLHKRCMDAAQTAFDGAITDGASAQDAFDLAGDAAGDAVDPVGYVEDACEGAFQEAMANEASPEEAFQAACDAGEVAASECGVSSEDFHNIADPAQTVFNETIDGGASVEDALGAAVDTVDGAVDGFADACPDDWTGIASGEAGQMPDPEPEPEGDLAEVTDPAFEDAAADVLGGAIGGEEALDHPGTGGATAMAGDGEGGMADWTGDGADALAGAFGAEGIDLAEGAAAGTDQDASLTAALDEAANQGAGVASFDAQDLTGAMVAEIEGTPGEDEEDEAASDEVDVA